MSSSRLDATDRPALNAPAVTIDIQLISPNPGSGVTSISATLGAETLRTTAYDPTFIAFVDGTKTSGLSLVTGSNDQIRRTDSIAWHEEGFTPGKTVHLRHSSDETYEIVKKRHLVEDAGSGEFYEFIADITDITFAEISWENEERTDINRWRNLGVLEKPQVSELKSDGATIHRGDDVSFKIGTSVLALKDADLSGVNFAMLEVALLDAQAQEIHDEYGDSSYDSAFVYAISEDEINRRIEDRQVPIETLGRLLSSGLVTEIYPEVAFQSFGDATPSSEPVIIARGVHLKTGGTNGNVGEVEAIVALDLSNGLEALTDQQYQQLSRATADDVIGVQHRFFQYNSDAGLEVEIRDENFEAPRWTELTIAARTGAKKELAPTVSLNSSDIVLKEFLADEDDGSYGLYRYIGASGNITLSTTDFSRTDLWTPIEPDHRTSVDDQVTLENGDIVSDESQPNAITFQIVNSVVIDLLNGGYFNAVASGSIAIQSDDPNSDLAALKVYTVDSGGIARLQSDRAIIDQHYGSGVQADVGVILNAGASNRIEKIGNTPFRIEGLDGLTVSLEGSNIYVDIVVPDTSANDTINLRRVGATGTIRISATADTLKMGALETIQDIHITASGDLLDLFEDTLTPLFNFDTQAATNEIGSGAITLSVGGNIGTASNPIDIRTGSATSDAAVFRSTSGTNATSSGDVFIRTYRLFTTTGIDTTGDISIDATETVTVQGSIIGNDILIDVETGSIVRDSSDVTFRGNVLEFYASQDFGTAASPILTEISRLRGIASGGAVWLDNRLNPLTIISPLGGQGLQAAGPIDIRNRNGNLTANSSVSASAGNVILTSSENIVLDAAVSTSTGYVTIEADEDVRMSDDGSVSTGSGSSEPVVISADHDLSGTGGIEMASEAFVDANAGWIDIDAEEEIRIGELRTSLDIDIRSRQGIITDDGTDSVNLYADNVYIESHGLGLVTASDLQGFVDTAINRVEMQGQAGDIRISNDRALMVGGITTSDLSDAANVDGIATSGNVHLIAQGDITVVASSNGESGLNTSGNSDVLIEARNGGSIDLSSSVNTGLGDIGLIADSNILQNAAADITTTGDVLIYAGNAWRMEGDTKVQGQNLQAKAETGSVTLDDLNIVDTAMIHAGTSVLDENGSSENISASKLSLHAVSGTIGSADPDATRNYDENANALDFTADLLAATSGTGSYLFESDGVTVDSVGPLTVTVTAATAPGGVSGPLPTAQERTATAREDLVTSASGPIHLVTFGGPLRINPGANSLDPTAVVATGTSEVILDAKTDSGDMVIHGAMQTDSGFALLKADGSIDFTAIGSVDTQSGASTVTLTADANENSSGGITMADGSFVDATLGLIDMDAWGNIVLSRVQTASDVAIDSHAGSITDADSDQGFDLIATQALLHAETGVGRHSNPMEVAVSALEVTATDGANTTFVQGNVYIDDLDHASYDSGGLVLGGIDATLDAKTVLSAANTNGIQATGEIRITTTGFLIAEEDVVSRDAAVTLRTVETSVAQKSVAPTGQEVPTGTENHFAVQDDGSNDDEDFTQKPGARIAAGTSVDLLIGDDVSIAETAQIEAGTELKIRADFQDSDVEGVHIHILGDITAEDTLIQSGLGDDLIYFSPTSLAGHTTIATDQNSDRGNSSEDVIIIDRLPTMSDADLDRDSVRDSLDVDGKGGSDTYIINSTGAADYVLNVSDTGQPGDGIDSLTINGRDDSGDVYLMRKNFVARLDGTYADATTGTTAGYTETSERVERINYDRAINGRLRLNTFNGADYIASDDNSALTTIDGGRGGDTFQIGQIFASDRKEGTNGIDLGDGIETTEVLLGLAEGGDAVPAYLTRGVSLPTVIFGGDGDDRFSIYSNKAQLKLFGEDNDDEFVVRAFALYDVEINTGDGEDTVEYNINAPVSIDGGNGIDTVVALGTPLADNFVITDEGIFGAGLTIRYENIEIAEVDGMEGDDNFYILSTNANVVTTVIGGLGSDTLNVAGDVMNQIVASNVEGQSGVINHSVESLDPDYDGRFVEGINLNVANGETAKVVIREITVDENTDDGETIIHEDPTGNASDVAIDRYAISLSEFASDVINSYGQTTAYLTVVPTRSSTADRRLPRRPITDSDRADEENSAQSVLVSTDGEEWFDQLQLTFDTRSNWDQEKFIYVKAGSDNVIEGERKVVVNHGILSNNPSYRHLDIPNVEVVVVDDDYAGLIIVETELDTEVEENGNTDSYTVSLTRKPATDEVIEVTLVADSRVAIEQLELDPQTLTFTPNNWDEPQTINVTAIDDDVTEDTLTTTIGHTISTNLTTSEFLLNDAELAVSPIAAEELQVEVADNDAKTVLIRESAGSTRVVEGQQDDDYRIRLNALPLLEDGSTPTKVRVKILTDGQTAVSSDDPRFVSGTADEPPHVLFDGNVTTGPYAWDKPITIKITALETDATGDQPIQSFSANRHVLSSIRGPLIVHGGIVPGKDRSLALPLMLPHEFDAEKPDLAVAENEDEQTDTLNLFNDDSRLDASANPAFVGNLSDNHVWGLGMGDDLTFEAETLDEVIYAGGISYQDFEVMEILLGSGDDSFQIYDTAEAMVTVVHGGGGNDVMKVHGTANDGQGALILLGDTLQDGIRYSAASGEITSEGRSFTNPGIDLIDASLANGSVVAYGGPGNDRIYGSNFGDQLAGGSGQDHIEGNGGADHIYGDTGFNLDLSARYENVRDGIVSHSLLLNTAYATASTDHTATSDDLVAAEDRLLGGDGDDVIFGDHGLVTQSTTTLKILSTDRVEFAETESPHNGASDVITGDGGADRIFGGSDSDFINYERPTTPGAEPIPILGQTGDDIIIADNGRAELDPDQNNRPISLVTEVPEMGGQDFVYANAGRKIVFGGAREDTIYAAGDDIADILVGDEGFALFDEETGKLTLISTQEPSHGARDTLIAGAASNVLVGGSGGDDIQGGSERDLVLGDNGHIALNPDGTMKKISSNMVSLDKKLEVVTLPHIGGDDDIDVGQGNDIVIAGVGSDYINWDSSGTLPEPRLGEDTGRDIVIGDSGEAIFDTTTSVEALLEIRTIDDTQGGSDKIWTDGGTDVVLGGVGSDILDAGTDDSRDIV
ncbi:MAG: hypothetical protein ACPGLY_27145, partial [Rubripirellula sp.]